MPQPLLSNRRAKLPDLGQQSLPLLQAGHPKVLLQVGGLEAQQRLSVDFVLHSGLHVLLKALVGEEGLHVLDGPLADLFGPFGGAGGVATILWGSLALLARC